MSATKSSNIISRFAYRVFIDGLSGMALGLFSTLIVGTILAQIGTLIGGDVGKTVISIANVAKGLTGAGIGVGVAYKFKESPLVTISAAVAGLVGAFAGTILTGAAFAKGALILKGPGEPLGAFLAAFIGIEAGHLISGRTKLDILFTPVFTIMVGGLIGLWVGPPISNFMTAVGDVINWSTEQQPLIMGVLVSVIMGMCLTLPISSAALGIILGLKGIAGGAAVIGCCCQMVGFAVMSYRDNRIGGLFAVGVGTSMLQMSNIVRKPVIWIPPILASAILGPVSSKVLGMVCGPVGSGMGTSGLVGQIVAFQSMTAAGVSVPVAYAEIITMHLIAPAAITFIFYRMMCRKTWIAPGDLRLDI